MNELKIFEHEEFGQVRIIDKDGNPWFVAKDVCQALGIANHRDAVKQAVERLKTFMPEEQAKGVVSNYPLSTPGGLQETLIFQEPVLYEVIFASRKPEAVKFRAWVTSEVLPSIRKHGAYMTEEKLNEILNDPDKFLDLAIKLREEKRKAIEERDKAIREKAWIGARREATAMATASAEKRKRVKLEIALDESKEWATVKRVEMRTSERYDWRKLKRISFDLRIPPRKVFDANYGQVNSYHRNVWLEAYGIDIGELD